MSSHSDRSVSFLRLLRWTLILFLVVFTYFTVRQSGDIRGVESNVVHTLQRSLIAPGNMYSDPEALPFHITQYSPGYYVAAEAVLKTLRVAPESSIRIRRLTRCLSLVFLLGAVAYMMSTVRRRLQGSVPLSVDLGLFMVVATLPWYHLSRPDALLLLCLAGAVHHCLGGGRRDAFIAGVWMGVGLATKMNAAFFILPLGLSYLVQRRIVDLLMAMAGGSVALLGLGSLFLLQGHSMEYLYKNVVLGIRNGSDVRLAVQKTYPYFLTVVLPFVAAILWLSLGRKDAPASKGSRLTLAAGLCCTVVLSLVSSIKAGSAENYFFEALYFALLLFISILPESGRSTSISALFLFLALSLSGEKAASYMPKFYSKEATADIDASKEEKLRYLKANLKQGMYFVSDDRNVSLALPEHAAMLPVDIHITTYREKTYEYGPWQKAMADGRIVFWVASEPAEELYGAPVRGVFEEVVKGVWKRRETKGPAAHTAEGVSKFDD